MRSSSRIRSLTFKAMELYEKKVKDFYTNLKSSVNQLKEFVEQDAGLSVNSNISTLNKCRNKANELYVIVQQQYSEFMKYLEEVKTHESTAEITCVDNLFVECESLVNKYLQNIKIIRSEKLEVMSNSGLSSSSDSLSIVQKKSAEAKAASVKLHYAEREVELKRQQNTVALKQADLNAEMELLQHRKEAATLAAEAEELRKMCTSQIDGSVGSQLGDEPEDKMEAVKNYVEKHATHFQPANSSESANLSQFLLRKDLILSRMTNFNDSCDNYQAWKASFRSVCDEMSLNSNEEIDLLVKYLGPVSKKYALSLRSAYLHDSDEAVLKIWNRLNERYGSPESVMSTITVKLKLFPRLSNKDVTKLFDLADILAEIEGLMENPSYASSFAYFNSSVGVNPIVSKLPYNLQQKWISRAASYKETHKVPFPPFSFFADFVKKNSIIFNDASFKFETSDQMSSNSSNFRGQLRGVAAKPVTTRKTDFEQSAPKCPIHHTQHHLSKCHTFTGMSHEEKRKVLNKDRLCLRCFSKNHSVAKCVSENKCEKCGKNNHHTLLHRESIPEPSSSQGGEQKQQATSRPHSNIEVKSSCTEICENGAGKSCAKIVLVNVINKQTPEKVVKCYAIVDDQSNKSLAKSELFDLLDVDSEIVEYTLSSCSGVSLQGGRKSENLMIQSIDGMTEFELPPIIECSDIPSDRDEIPSPIVAAYHSHLSDIAHHIPEVDKDAKILLLLGRDLTNVHHVLDQRIGPNGSPFAQLLPLGWVIVGEVCIGESHVVSNVRVSKTFVVGDGRASLLPPCTSKMKVSESIESEFVKHDCDNTYVIDNGRYTLFKPCTASNHTDMYAFDFGFTLDVRDDKPSLSVEDHDFLSLMDKEFVLDPTSKWSAPLPFKPSRPRLPNNRVQAEHRAKTLAKSLEKNSVKREHFFDFMGKLLDNSHAELAPPLSEREECWYLPIFGVYHPRKPDRVRVVFDSSAVFQGVSLNSVLLQGPDLTNSLLGVLLRFRREEVAVLADVEQMFYCFSVREPDRNFLRFLWHENNDPSKPFVEYRMTKHVFGNKPSPAIATYGLRKAVENSDKDVIELVHRNFYVDDGLASCPSVDTAVSLIKRTQNSLAATGIHLHKVTSSNPEVLKAFPEEDLAPSLMKFDFDQESLPTSRSLGLEWDLSQDCFVFSNQCREKVVSKRGILSTINGIFDPMGFLGPAIIEGRLLLRDVTNSGVDWDEPLSHDVVVKWNNWLQSLQDLNQVKMSRSLFKVSLSSLSDLQLHIFSDASEKAIASVVYIVGIGSNEKHVSFVMGKVKVAPTQSHTIPRLELCAAVLATELFVLVSENLHADFAKVTFYTDSRVVLGYICNQSRRFHTYVANRVQKIRRVSSPQQWSYICTEKNPADVGTRGSTPRKLKDSPWLLGPAFLYEHVFQVPEFHPLVHPDLDSEVRNNVVVMATRVQMPKPIECVRFERFSSWSKLLLAIGVLIHIVLSFKKDSQCKSWHVCPKSDSLEYKSRAKVIVLKAVQNEAFKEELRDLSTQSAINSNSQIVSLNPFLDQDGLLCVGGRLTQSSLPLAEKHPIILPGGHHIAKLIIRHFHESVHHQGRLFTEGAIRQGGFWIVGVKRAVSSYIFNCVICRKLRGRFETQKMSDLPVDRTEAESPFSYVGVDVFGPWQVVSRKTRSSQASAKRWAVLFTCMLIRAVHIEVVDEMSSSAFINALRRFMAIRGKVKVFRSDRGTNFVGATDNIGVNTINVEDQLTKNFLGKYDSVWIFNAPHSSHMGGTWERMIGVSRRILDSMLLNTYNLTHDVLVTLMAEVSAIVNARPITPISSDPECSEILSPSALLTMKLDHSRLPVGDFCVKDLYRDQWKRVQYLANQFWLRWKKEFLQSLQQRSKWNKEQTPLKVGDIVLLKDHEVARNQWPVARVKTVFPSADGKIRKVGLCFMRDSKQVLLTRPVVETILLVRD